MNNPWLALSTYEEKDIENFFGREADTVKVVSKIENNEYTVLYAASGDGKSSLLNAGVCPRLRDRGYLPIRITFPSDLLRNDCAPDFDSVVTQIIELNGKFNCAVSNSEDSGEHEKILEENIEKKLERHLWYKLRTRHFLNDEGQRALPILIFDQFEEVILSKWNNIFFRWLEMLSNDYPSIDSLPQELKKDLGIDDEENKGTEETDSVKGKKEEEIALLLSKLPRSKFFKCVFSMRNEYVGELDYLCTQKFFIPQMTNRYLLCPLSKRQAIKIIESVYVIHKDDDISKIIYDNREKIIENICKDSKDDVVSAYLLSTYCYMYYEQLNKDIKDTKLKDNEDIVYDYLRKKIDSFKFVKNGQLATVFQKLVSESGLRIREKKSEIKLILGKNSDKAYDELLNSKLFHENGDLLELSHDKLVKSVVRSSSLLIEKKESMSIAIQGLLLTLFCILLFPSFYDFFMESQSLEYVLSNGEKLEISNNYDNATITIEKINSPCILSKGYNLRNLSLKTSIDTLLLQMHDMPNLRTIQLPTTLQKKYSWENGVLWYGQKPGRHDSIIFASSYASAIQDFSKETATTNDSLLWEDRVYYDKKALYQNRHYITHCAITNAKELTKISDDRLFLLDTLDLSSFDKIESIAPHVFEKTKFECIILPPNLCRIGRYAFADCQRLNNLVFPDSVNIDKCAFARCVSLQELILPKSFTSFKYDSFYACERLKNVTLSDSVNCEMFDAFHSMFFLCDSINVICTRNGVKTNFKTRCTHDRTIHSNTLGMHYAAPYNGKIKILYNGNTFISEKVNEIRDIYMLDPDANIKGLDSISKADISLHLPHKYLLAYRSNPIYADYKSVTELDMAYELYMNIYRSYNILKNVVSKKTYLLWITLVMSIFVCLSSFYMYKKVFTYAGREIYNITLLWHALSSTTLFIIIYISFIMSCVLSNKLSAIENIRIQLSMITFSAFFCILIPCGEIFFRKYERKFNEKLRDRDVQLHSEVFLLFIILIIIGLLIFNI